MYQTIKFHPHPRIRVFSISTIPPFTLSIHRVTAAPVSIVPLHTAVMKLKVAPYMDDDEEIPYSYDPFFVWSAPPVVAFPWKIDSQTPERRYGDSIGRMKVEDTESRDSDDSDSSDSGPILHRLYRRPNYRRPSRLPIQRRPPPFLEDYLSDDSEDGGLTLGMRSHQLMDKAGLAESTVYELTNELRLSVTDEVRSKISSLDTELMNENEQFCSVTTNIEKYTELQQERDTKLDLQYQRTIAQALDNYLGSVQRDYEYISQVEERRIRDDIAQRREKAIQEEKIRQDRIKAQEEAKLKFEMAEIAKVAALEAEKKAAEEAAAKLASESLDTAPNAGKDSKEAPRPSVRNIIRASENALELEKRRQQIYEELSTQNKALNQDYHSLGKLIGRLIRTISATMENIWTRAEEIVKLINSPQYPQSISIKLFAEKIVSNCTNQRSSNAIFAASRVVVIVTSKIPLAMDIVIAELNRACIYTVPKHISYSEEAFRTKDDYFKAIGYMEVDGKIEGLDEYVERLSSYMKLYGALVQAEVGGFHNLHGTKEGWAWLARFLNTIPANLFTAVALDSFLGMAGYGMYCRYKNQFEKLLSTIARDYLSALREGGGESRSAKVSKVKMSIRSYIESKQYMKEPEGLQLRSHLDSHVHC